MRFAEQLHTRVQTGRRNDSRLRLALPAELITLDGRGPAQIENLSRSGARIATALAVKPGRSGFLRWLDHEVFATVRWCAGGRCGVVFDDLLSEQDLIRTRALETQAQQRERERRINSARDFVTGRGRSGVSD